MMNLLHPRIHSRKRIKAHTLIEMVAIITILGILAAVIVPRIQNISLAAKTSATQKEMVELQKAIVGDGEYRGFYDDNSSLPANLSDLYGIQDPGYNPFLQTGGRRGTYISEADVDGDGTADMLQDAWGTAYGWDSGTGVITSGGPDQAIGGGDDITVDVYAE
jgi:type II secretory pathway pseudopilin PulG